MQHHHPLPQQLHLAATLMLIWWKEQKQRKKNTDVLRYFHYRFKLPFFFGFVLICCDLVIFTLLTSAVLVPLSTRYLLISEFFTDVSTRWALPFRLGYRFGFNKLYSCFPWQISKTTQKRMYASLFPSKPCKFSSRFFSSALSSHINSHFLGTDRSVYSSSHNYIYNLHHCVSACMQNTKPVSFKYRLDVLLTFVIVTVLEVRRVWLWLIIDLISTVLQEYKN